MGLPRELTSQSRSVKTIHISAFQLLQHQEGFVCAGRDSNGAIVLRLLRIEEISDTAVRLRIRKKRKPPFMVLRQGVQSRPTVLYCTVAVPFPQ